MTPRIKITLFWDEMLCIWQTGTKNANKSPVFAFRIQEFPSSKMSAVRYSGILEPHAKLYGVISYNTVICGQLILPIRYSS